MADEPAPPARRPLGLRIAKWAGIAVAALVALAAGFLFFLDTQAGHRFVERQVEQIAFATGMKIDIGRIDGSIYGETILRDLAISDPKGVFLTAPEVRLDWRPFAYLSNHIDIRALTAGLVTLRRVPAFRATPPSDQPLLPDLDIDIARLAVDRFVAEAAVSGERRVARLAGIAHIADGRAQITFDGSTIGGGDAVALVLDAVPEQNKLDLDLRLDAPKGGVIAALAGLDQSLAVRLSGKGNWADWSGRLHADLGGSGLARLALTARDGTFAMRGPARIARLVQGTAAGLLGPVANLDFKAAMVQRRAGISGSLVSDAFSLTAKGIVDLAGNSFRDLNLQLLLFKPSVLAPNLSGSGLNARLTLNGEFRRPLVAFGVEAERLAFDDMALVDLRASGRARIDAGRIRMPVEARAARITGLDSVAGGKLENVRLAGNLAIDGPRILSDDMRIRSDRVDATAILVADTSKGLYTGAIDGRIDDYRVDSVGIFDIQTDVDLKNAPNGGFALVGRVSARSTQLLNESVRDFLGGNVVAAADVRYGTDGIVRFANLRLTAPEARITGGSGSYSPEGAIVLKAAAVTNAYGPVGVEVAGTMTNPRATVTAERPGLGIGVANLRAKVVGSPKGYRFDATADTDYGPLTADVTLGTGAAGALTINRADLAGIAFSGALRRTAAGPFAGDLIVSGQGVAGTVRLDAEGSDQMALVNLRAKDTVLPGPAGLVIGTAIVDARIVLYDQPHIVADVQLAQTQFGSLGLNIAAARASIDYRDGRGTAKLLAEGVRGAPFRVAANADLQPGLWRAALTGRVRGIEFRTTSPARIVPRDGEYELLQTRIDFGQGNMRLAGKWGKGIEIRSRLDSLDLSLANAFMPGLGIGGRATGSLDFSQPSAAAFPSADARLSIAGFTRTTAVSVSQPIDVNFVGKLLPDGGEGSAVMRRRGSVIGRLAASLRPLPPGAGDWTERLLGAALNGGIRYNGPADTLFSFAGQSDQRLSGVIGVAADFSGRVQEPTLTGIVRANDLVYENQTYGTRLSNLAFAGRFDGDRLEVERLTATAGDGTVSAKGSISLAAARGYPMDVTATLQNARLASSDALFARATGTLQLTKEAGQTALLSGELRLPETRYQITRQGAAEVPALTGVRFKPPRGPRRITGSEPAEALPGVFDALRLSVRLIATERLYASGMGLESEWSANLDLQGTSAAPRIAGNVELIRGTLGFAGRSFRLSEGRLDFTGGSPIDPVVALVGTDTIEDVAVNVNVSGRAMDPRISFSSVPGLPQDEIVSRILFGSSIGTLSTIQAVQLAASLNSLRGSGGGLNPLGKLRSVAGIDRLRIVSPDAATGRGTALAAGKYLTDDIYVEFITDPRGFTATQLEISLTPALSILSQAGGTGVTNVNVRYRKRY